MWARAWLPSAQLKWKRTELWFELLPERDYSLCHHESLFIENTAIFISDWCTQCKYVLFYCSVACLNFICFFHSCWAYKTGLKFLSYKTTAKARIWYEIWSLMVLWRCLFLLHNYGCAKILMCSNVMLPHWLSRMVLGVFKNKGQFYWMIIIIFLSFQWLWDCSKPCFIACFRYNETSS